MKATGNNRASSQNEKILSIRLSPDGLSFQLAGPGSRQAAGFVLRKEGREPLGEYLQTHISAMGEAGRVHVFLDTFRSVLVPQVLFKPESAAGYLAENGWTPDRHEHTVVSDVAKGIVSVMIRARDETEALKTLFGERLHLFSASHLLAATTPPHTAQMLLTRQHATLAIAGEGLLYADTLPFSSAEDLAYYIQLLQDRFALKKTSLYLAGQGAEGMRKSLRRYYKKVKAADETAWFTEFAPEK